MGGNYAHRLKNKEGGEVLGISSRLPLLDVFCVQRAKT